MERTKRAVSFLMVFVMALSALTCVMVSSADEAQAKVTKRTYLIKVNRKKNVVTVYKRENTDGSFNYNPIRAIRVSCGRATSRSSTTPKGIFKVGGKEKWCLLYGNVWGRYSIRFYRHYLFHTVPYKYRNKSASLLVKEYKKLGKKASAGCVRMSFIDEKWLSKTCPKGTKVVVYSSKQSGPLGKPKAVTFNKKVNVKKKWLYYDPTDPIKGNKGYNLKAPKIRIDADDEVKQGEVFDPKSGVTAKDERSFQDLTERIKYKIYKKEETTNDEGEPAESWERVSIVSTQNAGEEYKIKYSCYYKYCSKYTGKKTRYITIEGEEPDENEEQQD